MSTKTTKGKKATDKKAAPKKAANKTLGLELYTEHETVYIKKGTVNLVKLHNTDAKSARAVLKFANARETPAAALEYLATKGKLIQ